MPDHALRRIYLGCIAVAFSNYLWGVTLSPGVIVNGSFCVMIPKTPDAIDARSMANFLGVATLVWSVVLYAKSYRHLKRLRNKCVLWGTGACMTLCPCDRPINPLTKPNPPTHT